MPFDPTQPFVLLDDARMAGSGARLFHKPRAIIVVTTPDEVAAAIERLRQAQRDGFWIAGFFDFEVGYLLEPRLNACFRQRTDRLPLIWFGLFEDSRTLSYAEVEDLLGDSRCGIGAVRPRIPQARHTEMVCAAQKLVAAGDIYQANITFQADVAVEGHPLAIYRDLRTAQSAPHSALVHTGEAWALSFSPELFFEIRNGRIITRPMKGTAPRLPVERDDRAAIEVLATDPKNRAENLMIVDLLRNDLSRVAEPGSVEVSELFRVETYPTVHQMTSTIAARLRADCNVVDVLTTLFPCGSVTGAPKIRAMEVIAEIELEPRGLYTGSIGHIGPDDSASFNVAIRTLVINSQAETSLGLGSGIVADSEPASEWAECLTKAAFLTRSNRRFDLIETLRFDPAMGLVRMERHIDRLAASARHWGFAFDRHGTRNLLQATIGKLSERSRIRVLLAIDGSISVQASPLPPSADEPVVVAMIPLPIRSDDPRLFHKTTDRSFYDQARAASGAFEVLFVNERDELTEGSFTNLFVPRDGKLLTPPLSSGLLPGVLRAELIETGEAMEALLTPADLGGEFFIGNSLRGLIRVRLKQ